MKTSEYLSRRINELFLNGKWIANTNYKDCLQNSDWKIATNTSISKNSIALLAQHVHYYLKGVKDALEGKPLTVKDKYSFLFEDIKSQEQWDSFLQLFWDDAKEFAQVIEQMTEKKLNETFVKEIYGSNQRNVDAIIEHAYYHLGQIVLVKNALNKSNSL